ncbi:MAG: hypothetical protein AAF152_02440 [Cyanobacteria bacterium P01_A01_bin.114]
MKPISVRVKTTTLEQLDRLASERYRGNRSAAVQACLEAQLFSSTQDVEAAIARLEARLKATAAPV